MEKVTYANLDQLFLELKGNGPITKQLIDDSYQEYIKLQGAMGQLSRQVSKVSQKSVQQEAQGTGTPHEEVAQLRRELALKTSLCEDLQRRLQQRDREKDTIPHPAPSHDMVALIAEKYAGMFDTEWRHAFDFLDQTMNLREDKVLDTLQRILRAAFTFCCDVARAQYMNMEGEIYCPLSTWTENAREDLMDRKVSPTPETSRLAQTYRQNASYECIPALQEAFLTNILPDFIEDTLSRHEHVSDFVNKCVEISWYMRVQDKPMTIVSKVPRKAPFDTNLFKFYKHKGDCYDFIVWPALLVSEGGPVAARGVAQALDPNNRQMTSNLGQANTKSGQGERGSQGQGQGQGQDSPTSQSLRNGDDDLSTRASSPHGEPQHGTPSVDLPPLPDGYVSPSRVDPPQTEPFLTGQKRGHARDYGGSLTAAWRP